MLKQLDINGDWTLFLDRDGVINHEKNEDYIRHWGEFEFYAESLIALPLLAQKFNKIIITTNQKGIGKGLMTDADLANIHQHMTNKILELGGRIDAIYYCSDLNNDSYNRKPQPGMAFQAKTDFPNIDLNKAIMVGNRMSDMEFGRNAGMHTVYLATTHPEAPFPDTRIDDRFDHLFQFAQAL
ncbi:MAG: HAD-IIIA family hydrolase [Sediminibacterium sp.]|jgi:histidinol-phosphate phosphatase family protein|nr:HAD-IIIA family hydrolase [Sediminibacterium sp.]MBP6144018.1 HAD-IIIA family hydrolase [Sediminibacterium sp.]